jgi:hypothetical protein
MKSASISVEATDIRRGNTRTAGFDRQFLIIGLWVFAGYYLGCKIGFALTFKPHPVSVLWPPNSIVVAALFAYTTAFVVVCAPSRIPRAFGCTIPGSRSTADDFMLVH